MPARTIRESANPFAAKLAEKIQTELRKLSDESVVVVEDYNDCESMEEVKFKIITYRMRQGRSAEEAEMDAEREALEIWELLEAEKKGRNYGQSGT